MELLASADPDRADDYRQGLIGLVKRLRLAFPESKIVINRGFSVIAELYGTLDGVLAESLYRSFDYDSGTYGELSPADSQWLLARLKSAAEAGLNVYVIDSFRGPNRRLRRRRRNEFGRPDSSLWSANRT